MIMWLFTLPFRLVFGTAKLGTKAAAKTTAGSFKAGYRAGRLLGYRRMFFVAVGIGIGLLVAPVPGRELRAKLQKLLEEQFGGGVAGELPAVGDTSPGSPSSDGNGRVHDDAVREVTGTGPTS